MSVLENKTNRFVKIRGVRSVNDTLPDDQGNVDITSYTDEMAQDAVGAMLGNSLVYTDATPLLDTIQDIRTSAEPTFKNATLIGDDQPTKLNIIADNATAIKYPGFNIYNYGGPFGGFPTYGHPFSGFYNAGGTLASPTALPADLTIGALVFGAYDGTAFREVARVGGRSGSNFGASDWEGELYFMTGDGAGTTERLAIDPQGIAHFKGDIWPTDDNSYYLGENSATTPHAWKGLILKDQAGTGKYYRIEVVNNALVITEVT